MAEIIDLSYVEMFWNTSELPLGCYTKLYPNYELDSDEVVLDIKKEIQKEIKKEIKEEKERDESVGPDDIEVPNVKSTVIEKEKKKQKKEHKKLKKSLKKEKRREENGKKKLRKSESERNKKELAENGFTLIDEEFDTKKDRLYRFVRSLFHNKKKEAK